LYQRPQYPPSIPPPLSPDAPAFLSAPFLVDDVDLAARVLSSPAAAADRIAAATAGVLELDATLSVPVTAAGTANGVVTWVEVDLGEGGGRVAGCAWGDDRGGVRVAPSYGAAMHAMDGVWVTKVRKRGQREGGKRDGSGR
jgi:hypothetical protein